jgi:hypothetical protein
MTIDELIRQVRYCIDEEAFNTSNLDVTTDSDNTMLNNLIKSKIGDAFKWCAMCAPSELLVTESHSNTSNDIIISIKPNPIITEIGTELARFDLPATFLRLVRVKADNWKRAVSVAIEEDSEEYLCLSDDTAKATTDRPVAPLVPHRHSTGTGQRTEQNKEPTRRLSSRHRMGYRAKPRTTG